MIRIFSGLLLAASVSAAELRRDFPPQAPSPGERGWADLVEAVVPRWELSAPSLGLPFPAARVPAPLVVKLSLVGDKDGSTEGASVIRLDLRALAKAYGPASGAKSEGRLRRILSHEYTHLLTKAWMKGRVADPRTPLERALFECWYEGLGHYRSLSEEWVHGGRLTALAERTLAELGPVFAERLAALARAAPREEARLREGLSMGPFRRKWGALTVALWLAREAGGDDRKLVPWVEKGPAGVRALAAKHLGPLGKSIPPL